MMDVKDVLKLYQCKICSAHATGFHFDAQSCSACAAFFRRTISLNKIFHCHSGSNNCSIVYTEKNLCRACRFQKCLKAGMKKDAVQPRKDINSGRAYCTNSGLRRNKRFATTSIFSSIPPQPTTRTLLESIPSNASASTTTDDDPISSSSSPAQISPPTRISTPKSVLFSHNPLNLLIEEEMRIAERRRIMFCERPVGSLLGASKSCPYTKNDVKPLIFRNFRKSIRTHILLIYEWLRALPEYSTLSMDDQIALLRKCVLYHTVLDPCFITIQIGDLDKFIMQNGGYVSTRDDCDDGWQNEKEISRESKKIIYKPLLNRLMAEVIHPMVELNLTFEECVALKALVSFQGTLCNISEEGRPTIKKVLDLIIQSLYDNVSSDYDKAERFGNIVLLLSPIFDISLNFVESHHQVQFFDMWQLDSLLLQFLKV